MVDNRGPETLGVAIALIVGATVTLVLRYYVHSRLVAKRYGWEDGFMLVAVVGQAMFAICTIGSISQGAGRHIKDLSLEEASSALKWLWAAQIGYGIGVIVVRISIGLFLLRFIISSIQRWIIYITIGISASVSLIVFLIGLFECKPLHIFWDPARSASCNSSKLSVVTGVIGSFISILCDFSLAIVPMVLVWGLNLSRRTKVALIPIFGLGCCASVGAVLEIVYLISLDAHDFTYGIMIVALWSHVELGVAVYGRESCYNTSTYRRVMAKLGFGSGNVNVFRLKTPRWTAMFTRDEQRNPNTAHRTPKRQSATQESYTLVDSMNRERPKPLEHIGRLPDPERQDDRTASSDDILPLVN